jgi:biopolymer transport protein ExbD
MKIAAPKKRASSDWQLQLINIVFLLLLFFVMNGTISNIQDWSIEIPKTTAITEGGPVAEAAYIDNANTLSFRGAPATASGIARIWLSETRQIPFLVVVDRRLPAVQLMARLQELKAAGLPNLSLVTLREPGDAK